MDPLLKAALEVSRDTNYSFGKRHSGFPSSFEDQGHATIHTLTFGLFCILAAAITFVICDILQKFDDEVSP